MPRRRVPEIADPDGYPIVKGRTFPKDPSKLSTKPQNIRRRLRNHNADIERDIAMILPKPLDEWDLEELARGKPRDRNGGWMGRTGAWLTPKLEQEIKRRLIKKTFGNLTLEAGNAIKAVHRLITSQEIDHNGKPIVPPGVQLDAAKFVIEQIIGKATAKIDIEEGSNLHSLLAAALINPDGSVAHPVIEGEIMKLMEEDDEE